MRRREILCALGGGVVVPLGAFAEQRAGLPTIGYLNGGSAEEGAERAAGFRAGLRALGYVEGESVAIEYRWAEGRFDRLPALAADLVRRQVAVIVTAGGEAPARAAEGASPVTPVVFVMGSDPVKAGLVSSLSRPGGNMTGVTLLDLVEKRLGLLREVVPGVVIIGFVMNPHNPAVEGWVRNLQGAAASGGVRVVLGRAGTEAELEAAFSALVAQGATGFVPGSDPFFDVRRAEVLRLAARHALPGIYEWREFAVEGGLLSYGTRLAEANRQAGLYAGRILRGVKPADLPVIQPTSFELALNLKTAKALGLTIPASILARADEVIE